MSPELIFKTEKGNLERQPNRGVDGTPLKLQLYMTCVLSIHIQLLQPLWNP